MRHPICSDILYLDYGILYYCPQVTLSYFSALPDNSSTMILHLEMRVRKAEEHLLQLMFFKVVRQELHVGRGGSAVKLYESFVCFAHISRSKGDHGAPTSDKIARSTLA